MTNPEERLRALAEQVLDGVPIDWRREFAEAPELLPSLEVLHALDGVARTHRTSARAMLDATARGAENGEAVASRAPFEHWGPLRVFDKIGEGGFGEVFRAYDPRLQIEVALKLFRPESRRSAESLLAEARSLARVRHPNVLAVFGADEHEGSIGMWTELVQGRTLERILQRQGLFSAYEATVIGTDLCRALAAVHATGFMHGDVKASNVMREHGGRIVLMDFGTVRFHDPEDPQSAGAAAGTPMSMAPELLRGDSATRRSDLYALGVLLYRLVSGNFPFEATSIRELKDRHAEGGYVPLRDRRPELPARFIQVVERAMHPDPDERYASAGEMERALVTSLMDSVDDALAAGDAAREAALSLEADLPAPGAGQARAGASGTSEAAREASAAAPRAWPWVSVVLAAVAIAAGLALHRQRPRGSVAPVSFAIPLPHGYRFSGFANMAVAPDGKSVAFSAVDSSGTSRLWLRRFDLLEPRALPGTEGAFYPFWSPDSRRIGYFANRFMRTTSIEGGRPQILCAARAGRGASWSRNNVILFAPNTEGPLYEVPASGGEPIQVTSVDSTAGEIAHRWPCWMPDGEHFLYLTLPPAGGRFHLYAGQQSSDRRVEIGTTSSGVTLAPGALVHLDDQTLVAHPFDARHLRFTGHAIPISDAKRYGGSLGEPHASASASGAIVYQNWTSRLNHLVWIGRAGTTRAPLTTGAYFDPRISPDGTEVAVECSHSGTSSDVWLIDATSGAGERFTTAPGLNRMPLWSPDSRTILYASNRTGRYELYSKQLGGSQQETPLATDPRVLLKWPTDWNATRGTIAYTVFDPRTGYDVWLRTAPDPNVGALTTQRNEAAAGLSPDGAWLAYQSDESGAWEVYCQRTSGGTAFRVSRGGGVNPCWNPRRKELFFRTPAGDVMSAPMAPRDSSAPARALFREPNLVSYDVDRSGTRFLCSMEVAGSVPDQLTVILNWTEWMNANR